jgi:MscS family membrane protein
MMDRDMHRRGLCAEYRLALLLLALALFWTLHTPAVPQERPAVDATEAAREPHSVETYDPGVPVGAVRAYIDACRRGDYEQAAGYLDLGPDRAVEGPKLAWQLKVVLDRKLWIQYELLNETPQGNLDDALPPDLERLGSIGDAEILLRQVQDPDGTRVWKFASSTVGRIPSLYARFGYGRLGEYLPEAMFELRFLEVQLWQWAGLLLLIPAALLVSWLGGRIIFAVLRPIVARTKTHVDDRILDSARSPFRFLLALGIFMVGALGLAMAMPVYTTIGLASKVLVVILVSWFCVRLIDVFATTLQENLQEAGKDAVAAVLPLGKRVAKVFLGIVAVVLALQNLGFNVTGLIAGLGVGGLAVALAAQKSVANLFGGVSLVADQPVRVGDFCRFGDGKVGTVEEIGLRSTRVRTLDRTLLTIPNAEFSEVQLENFGPRDRIRLFTVLNLRYETSPDQLRYVLTEVRKLLAAHPMIEEIPARARFVALGPHSLDVEIFAYVGTNDWNTFLQVREDFFLRVMDIVAASGTGFAFPSQTLYLGRDGGLDPQKTLAAEKKVQTWREENTLPFPEFSEAMRTELEGTVDYPPRGSVAHVDSPDDGREA